MTVETMRGPIPAEALGRVSMHEHVLILGADLHRDYPELSWKGDREARIAEAVGELDRMKAGGIDSLVDLTVPGLGRAIHDLAEIAARTELNIVVATGFYTTATMPLAWRAMGDGLAELFVREIEVGISDSGVKAGMLKCCTDIPGMTPDVEQIIRAVAAAHRQTGAPITTHTRASERNGLDQQRIFAEEGVDLSRVVIGHCGDTTDIGYLREVMDRGSAMGADRFGFYLEGSPALEERVATIAQLCALGYADRIVLGHDANCHADFNGDGNPFGHLEDWHLGHLTADVLPALARAGVGEDDLERMLVANPARLLASGPAY